MCLHGLQEDMPKVQHRASAAVHLDDGSRRGLTQASRCGGGRWPRDFRVPEIQQAHTCAGYGDDPAQYWPPAPAQFCARVQEDNQLGLNVDVESGHLEHISSALRENQVLTHLDLSYNNLAEQIRSVIISLATIPNLSNLDLSGNAIQSLPEEMVGRGEKVWFCAHVRV